MKVKFYYTAVAAAAAVDVLWGQPIKLAQVASTSELLENQWNNLAFCRASEAQKLTASKIKYEKFGPKILIPFWKMNILVP